jgi:hypothetical protein
MIEKLSILLKDLVVSDEAFDNGLHLKEAFAWLCRAQDANPDRGVSHSYLIGTGWAPSYPETTGYIIPTFLNWSILTGSGDARRRALQMADWELSVQLDCGAIPALSNREPVVFDTGQVLFGWLAAHAETGDPHYLEAAVKGGNWLLAQRDSDHVWRKFGNPGSPEPNLYNVRFAWALLDLFRVTGDRRYRVTVEQFIDWVLAQEEERGWFRYNCLTDNDHPLLHTIAYTAQGLLESGLILGDDRCLQAVGRMADELAGKVGSNGRMAGRFGRGWQPAASWACLTGMAQMAIVWQRLDQVGGQGRYRAVAQKAIGFLTHTQNVKTSNEGIRGGIKGSFPVNGDYGAWRMLNWAAKFFVDALILAEYPDFDRPLY